MAELNLSQAALEEVFGVKITGKGQEVPKDMAKEFKDLAEEMRQTSQAADQLSQETQKLDTSLKKTTGKDESEGFAGLATNVLKAERAINALVSGHGLARAAPLLEGLLTTIGGPAGLGAAFVAMEVGARVLGPTLEKFLGAVTGEKVAQLKDFADHVKRLREEGQKLSTSPLVKAEEGAAKKFLEAGAGEELRQNLTNRLRKQFFGLSEEERQRTISGTDEATRNQEAQGGRLGQQAFQRRMQAEDLLKKSADASETEALKLIARTGEGNVGAQVEIERILGDVGKALMQKLRERLQAAIASRKEEIAKEDFVGPPAPPPKTPDQRLREELMEQARAEDTANQKRRQPAATPQFLKDVVGRAATNVGAGMDKKAAMEQAIADSQDAQRDRAEAEAKKRERDAVHAEMQRRGFHGTPEQWDTVTRNAIKDLPMTAGNIMRAVQLGYLEAVRQLQQESHNMNKKFGNSFQQQGSPW